MERPPIKALDTGDGAWFHVDTILRPGAPVSEDDAERFVAAVCGSLEAIDGPEHGRDPEMEVSYDFSPPEGDLGVALWVRAPSIGAAVDAAATFVLEQAAAAGLGVASIWDVRALPEDAVLDQRADWP